MAFEIYLGISELIVGQAHINSNNPPPDLKCPFRDLLVLTTVRYTSVSAESVKLNFHLELQATLIHNLNNGLRLELQVLCEQALLKAKLVLGCQ
jgi:hypothetical protein